MYLVWKRGNIKWHGICLPYRRCCNK